MSHDEFDWAEHNEVMPRLIVQKLQEGLRRREV